MIKSLITFMDVLWCLLLIAAPMWSRPSRSYYTLAALMIIAFCGSVFYMWNP